MPSATSSLMPDRIITGLKRVMKSRQVTYRELARRIHLSEATIKRIFSRATLTIGRLDEICVALEVNLSELLRMTDGQATDAPEYLTLEQERALAADPKLLACFYLLANGRSGREIGVELGVNENTVRRWMVRLDALRLIEMRSRLRARARAASVIAWRRDGPLRARYEQQVRQEFLQATFSRAGEALQFLSAELSEASSKVLLRKMERLAGEFRDLAELDRSVVTRDKRSIAMLLAVRPWVFSMFAGLQAPSVNPVARDT
jgi:DNA-binding Xre family transcriptional regulator/DNA-binding transcriptional regulator YhcF (GntR family)